MVKLKRIDKEQKVDRHKMLYEAYKKKQHHFKKLQTIYTFRDAIENGTITIYIANYAQNQ